MGPSGLESTVLERYHCHGKGNLSLLQKHMRVSASALLAVTSTAEVYLITIASSLVPRTRRKSR